MGAGSSITSQSDREAYFASFRRAKQTERCKTLCFFKVPVVEIGLRRILNTGQHYIITKCRTCGRMYLHLI